METATKQEAAVVGLTPGEAKKRLDAGDLVIVDVRMEVEYASVHAEGVEHIPMDRFDPAAVMRRFDGKSIACICKGGTRGGKAAKMLLDAGAPNVANVVGGTQAWEAAGLPVERSSRVMPIERQVLIGAGSLVVAGVLLAYFVSPLWIILSLFVGCGLMFAGLTGFCGMALVLAKMPWNRNLSNKSCGGASCAA